MEKSLFTVEYAALVRLLRDCRKEHGMTQGELAERIGETQSFVSKAELCGRRLDMAEVRAICQGLGIPLRDVVDQWEAILERKSG